MKKLLSVFLSALMLLSVLSVAAGADTATYSGTCGAEGDNVTWEIDVNTGTLYINGTGDMADYDGYVNLPWYAYQYSPGFTDVVIGEGVTSISDYAFVMTEATKITLSSTVKELGVGCLRLTADIFIDEENPYLKMDEYGVIYSKDGKTLICASKYIYNRYTVPEGVEEFAPDAFYHFTTSMSFQEVLWFDIPASVNKIPVNAFGIASVKGRPRFNVDEDNPYYSSDEYGVLFDKNKEILYMAPFCISAHAGPYVNYTIPETVKEIADYAFYGITKESIFITENVTKIGSYAFCPSAEVFETGHILRLYIPKTVTTLADDFFGEYEYPSKFIVFYEGTQTEWEALYKGNKDLFTVYYEHEHSYAIAEETCAQKIYTCNGCKTKVIEANAGHDWFTYDNIPACTGGTATYYCRNCSTSKTEEIAPTEEHDWYLHPGYNIYPCKGGNARYHCYNCSVEKMEYIEPTEAHDWVWIGNVVEPCVGGAKEYYCSKCNDRKSGEYIEPTGEHSWLTNSSIYPCLGGTIDYHCEWCGETKSEYVAPTEEHSYYWDEGSDDIQCEGGYANLYCTSCYNYYDTYIEAEGHSYYYVSDNNATCTKDGTKSKECSRCNDIAETVVDVGSKLGHDLTETTVLSQTTCTQDGISVQACKRCAEIVATIEGAYGHFDNDGDGKCDECKVVLEVILPEVPSEPETDVTPEDPESPEEPQESNNILAKIMEFFNKIINILKKLFGI